MSIEPGQTLLHYRIVDKLGEDLSERLARVPISVDQAIRRAREMESSGTRTRIEV